MKDAYDSGDLNGVFDNRELMQREYWRGGKLLRTLTATAIECLIRLGDNVCAPFGCWPDPKDVSNLWINPS